MKREMWIVEERRLRLNQPSQITLRNIFYYVLRIRLKILYTETEELHLTFSHDLYVVAEAEYPQQLHIGEEHHDPNQIVKQLLQLRQPHVVYSVIYNKSEESDLALITHTHTRVHTHTHVYTHTNTHTHKTVG